MVIPEPLFKKIETIKQQLFLEHGLKGALRSPSHITLHRPFEWKEEKQHVLIEKLEAIDTNINFDVELNHFSFFEPRVIYVDVLPNTHLLKLYQTIKLVAKTELRLFNEVNNLRGFHPHITIANRDLKKPLFYELQTQFKTQKLTGSFECNSFCVLKLEKKWEVLKQIYFTKR